MKAVLAKFKHTFSNFHFFYANLRYRVWVLIVLSVLVGLFDGLGLAMFLPLLEVVANPDGDPSGESLGKLGFVVRALNDLGLPLSLTVILMVIFLFFCIKGFFRFCLEYCQAVYQQYFLRKIREESIDYFSIYKYEKFVNADAGRIQNTMGGEVQRVSKAYTNYMNMARSLILVFTYTFMAFIATPEFATLVAVGGMLTNLIFSRFYKATKGISRSFTEGNHLFQGLVIEFVAHFKYLKATGLIEKAGKRLKDQIAIIEYDNRKMGVLNGILVGLREPLMMGVVVGVILIEVNVLGGDLNIILLSILLFYRALTALTTIQTVYNRFLSVSGSLENVQSFISELKEGIETNGQKPFKGLSEGIELIGVGHHYDDQTVLNDINLRIAKNESLAFVGESGSGKTTLMNIIAGLISPKSGKINVNGEGVSVFDLKSFQRKVGYITQEPVIFDDSLFNNVTFWADKNPDNLQRFREALEKAAIWQLVQEMPDKEETKLGNNGIKLSGGQRQRISIARELYKEVDFLLMDEATSALDSETEFEIQENIDALKGSYTIITIAHRLSTIKNADRVVVMNKGQIEIVGTYEELMEGSTSLKRMVELQEL